MRNDVRQETRARFESLDLVELIVRADRSEMDDLIETEFEPRRFGVEKNRGFTGSSG